MQCHITKKAAISFIVLSGIAAYALYQYYPQIWLIPWMSWEFNKFENSQLYVIPSEHKEAGATSCGEAPSMYEETLKVMSHNLELSIPSGKQKSFIDYGNGWYSISYEDERFILVAGLQPTLSEWRSIQPDKETSRVNYIDRHKLNSKEQLVQWSLNTSPNHLSFFGNVDDLYSKIIALNIKRILVPRSAHGAYSLRVDDEFNGFQMGDPGVGDGQVYVHLFDKQGDHHLMVFRSFLPQQLDCILSSIKMMTTSIPIDRYEFSEVVGYDDPRNPRRDLEQAWKAIAKEAIEADNAMLSDKGSSE